MENIKVYVESGQVFILSGSSAITGLNTSLSTAPQPIKFPANGELTASVVNTNNIKVVTSTGQIVLNNVPFGNLKEKNGTTAIGASATAVRDNLNSTHIFGSTTLETKLGVETAKITALENATKTATNDRGIYINDAKGTTQGHLQLTDTIANLQAGATTAWNLTDISTGQGSIIAKVRAGSNGNQTSVTAMTIAGDSSLNNTLTTFHEPVTFGSSVAGIDLADLDNVHLGSPSDGDVLTWDNTNSYWKPVAPGSLSLTALLTDVFSAQGLGLSAVDAGADKFVMWDDSEGKLTYFTPGSAFSIQGTSINVRNLSNSNMTISSGTRSVNLSSSGATFRVMTGQGTPFSIENDGGNAGIIRFNGDVRFDSGSLSGGILKLEENPQGGSNFVALQAPSSLSGDLTFKLPATDGSSGQFLKTDGSGNLSFASAGGGSSTSFKNVYPQSFIDDIGTTKHYLPFKDINEQTTIYQEEAAVIMPYDGKIVSVSIRMSALTGNGNFTVGIHTFGTGTGQFTTANWTEEETETMAFTSTDDYHTFHFVFDNAQHFEAGDLCSISFQASADPGSFSYWYVSTVVEFDTTSDLGSSSTEHESNP